MLVICIVLLAVCITGFVIATLNWKEHVTYHYVTSLRTGKTHLRPSGWPYTVRVLSGWIIAITGVSTIINLVVMARVKTAYAMNKDGLQFIIPGAMKPFFAEWKDIESIQEFNRSSGQGATIHFHSMEDIIKKQGGKQGKYIAKKTVSIDSSTAKGDIGGFISTLQARYQASKNRL